MTTHSVPKVEVKPKENITIKSVSFFNHAEQNEAQLR